jgi:hypothetical protein
MLQQESFTTLAKISSSILDQSGKFFFFARFGAKNMSDLPEAKLT